VVGRHADQNADCPECRGLHFDRAYAAGRHTGALRAVVIAMKTMPTVPLRALDEIRSCLERSPAGRYDAILPVPLAPRREFDRGFNQAEVLAKYVGEMLGVDVDRSSLGREKYVPINRAGMDRKARVATVEKAFKVVRPRLVEGRRILLVDDVMTTGSTASACAEALKRKGAARVDVFTITRAASHGHFND
jgi:ComF family protein